MRKKTNNPPLAGRVIDFSQNSWLWSKCISAGIRLRICVRVLTVDDSCLIAVLWNCDFEEVSVVQRDIHLSIGLIPSVGSGLCAVFV